MGVSGAAEGGDGAGGAAVGGPAHVTGSVAALAEHLPPWASLVRAPNPGPMTLAGTNSWVLRAPGQRQAVVVDPGPLDEGHLRALAAYGPVGLILITHGHLDHVEGARRFAELVGGVAVRAAAAQHCAGAEPLRPDERVRGPGLEISVLATPGHTGDSVSFLVRGPGPDGTPAVLTGDTILGRGTTVVAWPSGDLGDYLASLRRLAGLGPLPVLPGHGPPLADCAAAADYYLAHRLARLDQVRAVRAAGASTVAEVVAAVYREVDRALWPAAEMSVQAQLSYLDRPGPGGDPAGRAGEASAGGTAEGGVGPVGKPQASRESAAGSVGLDTP